MLLTVPVHSTNSVNIRSIVYLLSFRAIIYLGVNIYLTSLDESSKVANVHAVCDRSMLA